MAWTMFSLEKQDGVAIARMPRDSSNSYNSDLMRACDRRIMGLAIGKIGLSEVKLGPLPGTELTAPAAPYRQGTSPPDDGHRGSARCG